MRTSTVMKWALAISLGWGVAGCEDAATSAVADADATTATDARPDATEPTDATGTDASDAVAPAAREAGERRGRRAPCEEVDGARCLLPWPSSAFLAEDADTATGFRVALPPDELLPDEPIAPLERANGFSRLTPILASVPPGVDPDAARAALHVMVTEPGPRHGEAIAMRRLHFQGAEDQPSLVVGYPLAPLDPDSEHLAYVQGFVDADGVAAPPTRATEVALGTAAPADADEAALFAYHAPARELLEALEVAPASVQRLWDFRTRTEDDALDRLRGQAADAREAISTGAASIALDRVEPLDDAEIAVIVTGRVTGLVDRTATTDDGGPWVYEVPFRIVLPAGDADYRCVFYGHGAAGDVNDDSFDRLMADAGAAKIGIEVDGWTGDSLFDSISKLLVPLDGTAKLTAKMRRSQAGIAAIHAAMAGELGDLLAAETFETTEAEAPIPNPAAGRRAILEQPIWAGGSLGGVTGMVYGHLEPSIAGGVLNVPGAGFTHWLGASLIWDILRLGLEGRYPDVLDMQLVMAMSQGLWDEVDGGIWAGTRDEAPLFLVQISVGDPIMPNLASELVASALDAVQVGVPLDPIAGLEQALEVQGRSGVTQYLAPGDSPNAIHGFTARDTAAGHAAQAQFIAFIETLWAGDPRISVPEACQVLDPPNLCDFSEPAAAE